MDLPINEIVTGDCLSVMKGWPDGCVDLVFGSPPYEDARTYGIDFSLKGQDWVDWMVKVYQESLRVCKGLVAFVVECKTRQFRWSATPALLMADLHRAGVKLRRPLHYHRVGIPGSGGPDWMRADTEYIVCAAKGKLPWSDNTAMGHPPKWAPGGEMSYRQSNGTRRNKWGKTTGHMDNATGNRKKDGTREKYRRPSDDEPVRLDSVPTDYVPPVKANPGNVIFCKVGGGQMGSKIAHENEAPFPESLAEFMVRSFCPPGGVVLDCFAGSGTVAATAKKAGRNWIAVDIRESQTEIIARRVKEADAGQMVLWE